jgi:hypothetical protein
VAEVLADARTRLAMEVKRLRMAAALGDVERADMLADLGTRLAVLVAELRGVGASEDLVAPLASLVCELAGCESAVPPPDALQTLWHRTITHLESLAVTTRS